MHEWDGGIARIDNNTMHACMNECMKGEESKSSTLDMEMVSPHPLPRASFVMVIAVT
jgi:hypothetical protein